MSDEKTDETDDQRVDQANAGTLEEPREQDEGGEDQLDPIPDA